MKKYKFFYHFYKAKKCMSVHFKGKSYTAKHIICNVSCQTKWNKRQPYLVMEGYAINVSITDDLAIIE
jgi:hypothetical protein